MSCVNQKAAICCHKVWAPRGGTKGPRDSDSAIASRISTLTEQTSTATSCGGWTILDYVVADVKSVIMEEHCTECMTTKAWSVNWGPGCTSLKIITTLFSVPSPASSAKELPPMVTSSGSWCRSAHLLRSIVAVADNGNMKSS